LNRAFFVHPGTSAKAALIYKKERFLAARISGFGGEKIPWGERNLFTP
jgi:hypothetical protein